MVAGSRLRVAARVDEGESPVRYKPSGRQPEELIETFTVDVADPEAGEEAVDHSVGFRPNVAHTEFPARAA